MRSRHPGWIMPDEDLPSMLRIIEKKIASSEIEIQHRHALIRLRHILEQDLQRTAHMGPANIAERHNQKAVQLCCTRADREFQCEA